ncbi:LOW QUALITY PROTEIN: Reverse transcriptase [Phytophthora palmivora]|uniref:Reverse transcriptase n=1 Tax=Phytophthora palmivora TaxID=4796 RepID=A0A2P4YB60_9STRA|nr:LOW QUALITY PROTEIN: Reverse transcriptase [Phytophthora palmivora]
MGPADPYGGGGETAAGGKSAVKLKVAGYAIQRWMEREKVTDSDERQRVCRIGFFDGGSRGNPGRAGSGSVIVEVDQNTGEVSILWAAATALGSRRVSNNVAEFTGLQRLLAHAQSQGWRIHVVGDSALILRMMNRAQGEALTTLVQNCVEIGGCQRSKELETSLQEIQQNGGLVSELCDGSLQELGARGRICSGTARFCPKHGDPFTRGCGTLALDGGGHSGDVIRGVGLGKELDWGYPVWNGY